MGNLHNEVASWFDLTFMGHGHCYLWRSDLVLLHSVSDTLIAGAYFTIPLALYVLMYKRKDLEYEWMFLLFALFIFSCGLTHLMAVYNIWNGAYYLSGVLKAITAIVSVLTAALIWPLIPKALALPRPIELQAANEQLQEEIQLRIESEGRLKKVRNDLEIRVKELELTKEKLEEEIDRRRSLEIQERARTEALRRSNEDLEQFAFIASHDLREPLRKMLTFSQMLMLGKYGQFNDKGNQFVTYIREAAERMDALLASLLQYSRINYRPEDQSDVDLQTTVEHVCKDLQLRIEETDATIRTNDLCKVHGHSEQLRQLLQNLIGNAIKYRSPSRRPCIVISAEQDCEPGWCRISISDNGIGFDMKYGDQIFEVFRRLHGRGAYEGTGMGLAICRKIVERHGGRIWAESQEGEGSCFMFELPMAQVSEDPA